MFARVTLHAADLAASQRFYETVLPAIGIARPRILQLEQAADDGAVTRGLHIGFAANSRADVDAFWQAGVDAGYRDDGAPGPRPEYSPDYYGGFLLDPDGNSAEAMHDATTPEREEIDHLWIRVADLVTARDEYLTGGSSIEHDGRDRVMFRGTNGSFSLVVGPPSENVDFELR
jgi:predicted lactoylglutathione lyase